MAKLLCVSIGMLPLITKDAPIAENWGVLVPMPTIPLLEIIKSVAVDEPIANTGPLMPFGLTDSCAQGVVVPIPTLPENVVVPVIAPPVSGR